MSPTDIRPEPVWGVAQPEVEPCSSFESGATPIMITGFIVRLLQYHFYDPGNIMHEMLKSYRWQPDCAKGIVQPDNSILRPIHVGTSYEFTPGNVQQRPGLFVKREPMQTERIAVTEGDSGTITPTFPFRGKPLQKRLQGRYSIICISSKGEEADLLGEEVFYRMLHFQSLIRKEMRLGAFSVEGLGEVQTVDADGGSRGFYTVVSLFWAMVYRWAMVPEAPILKRLNFITNMDKSDKGY